MVSYTEQYFWIYTNGLTFWRNTVSPCVVSESRVRNLHPCFLGYPCPVSKPMLLGYMVIWRSDDLCARQAPRNAMFFLTSCCRVFLFQKRFALTRVWYFLVAWHADWMLFLSSVWVSSFHQIHILCNRMLLMVNVIVFCRHERNCGLHKLWWHEICGELNLFQGVQWYPSPRHRRSSSLAFLLLFSLWVAIEYVSTNALVLSETSLCRSGNLTILCSVTNLIGLMFGYAKNYSLTVLRHRSHTYIFLYVIAKAVHNYLALKAAEKKKCFGVMTVVFLMLYKWLYEHNFSTLLWTLGYGIWFKT